MSESRTRRLIAAAALLTVTAGVAVTTASSASAASATAGCRVTCTGTASTTAAPRRPTPPATDGPRATFTNPIKTQGPDPWLTHYNGFYYLATTTWNNTITMRKSATLGGLRTAPDTLLFTLTRPNGAGTMWAPEFFLLDGPNGKRWYFYYTAGREPYNLGTQRIHVLESAGLDPMGPYAFKADLLDPTADNTWELDPGILRLNGGLYLLGTFYNGSQPLFIRPLSNPWTAGGTRRILSTPTLSWETVGGAVNEGGEVLQRDGKTFIVYSASHCSTPDYKLGMLTHNGGDPLLASSWTKSPQPVFQRDNVAGSWSMPTELHPSYPVRTERLLLRPLTMADVDALVAYRSIPDLCRYVPFSPQNRADIEARIEGVFANHALTGEGQNLTLGMELAATGELVGDVILMYHSQLHAGGEVGWILNPAYGGHGYATEAAREMLRLGFEVLGLRRIVARIDERNAESARLARRLGMRQEARLVENEFFKGEWTTELDFAMLATEWFASHAAIGATPPAA